MEGILSMHSGAEPHSTNTDLECRFGSAEFLGKISASSTVLRGLSVFIDGSSLPREEGGP